MSPEVVSGFKERKVEGEGRGSENRKMAMGPNGKRDISKAGERKRRIHIGGGELRR